jgi:hypothetical protein
MKRKSLTINKTGRLSLIAEIARFFGRPWTLQEATVFLQGSSNLLEENQKLLALIKKLQRSDDSNRELEPIQTPANDSKTHNAPTQ